MARRRLLRTEQASAAADHGPAATSRRIAAGTPLPVLPNVARFLVERSSPGREPLEPRRPPAERGAHRSRLDAPGRGAPGRTPRRAAAALPPWRQRLGVHRRASQRSRSLLEPRSLRACPRPSRRAAIEGHAERAPAQPGPATRSALPHRHVRPGGSRVAAPRHHPPLRHGRPLVAPLLGGLRGHPRGPRARRAATPRCQPSTSFQEWAHTLKRRADSDALRGERRAWLDLGWDRVRAIPLDHRRSGRCQHQRLGPGGRARVLHRGDAPRVPGDPQGPAQGRLPAHRPGPDACRAGPARTPCSST